MLAEKLQNVNDVSVVSTQKKRGGIDFNFAKVLSVLCRKEKVNLIHCHDSHAHTAAILATLFFGLKAKIIVSRRVDFPISKSFVSQYKYHHSSIAAILCVSDAINEIVKRNLPKQASIIQTVHSGVQLQHFDQIKPIDLHHKYSIPVNRKLVINTAALADHKDYPTFINTICAINKSETVAHGLIVGDGELRNDLEGLVKELGAQDFISFLGYQKNVLENLKGADCFLFPSKMEGLGTSVLDAFGCLIPVVATRAGGIPEMVINGETGLLADIGDSRELASLVLKVLDERALREKLIGNARAKLDEFSVHITAEKTAEVYQKHI